MAGQGGPARFGQPGGNLGRPCYCCSLPDEKRREVLARTLAGHQWNDIAESLACSSVAVLNHAKHVYARSTPEDYEWVREWSAKTILPVGKELDRARTLVLAEAENTPTLNASDISNRLLLLERHCHNVLRRIEVAAERGDAGADKSAIAGLNACRLLVMDLATINGARNAKDNESVVSADTAALLTQIEMEIAKKTVR